MAISDIEAFAHLTDADIEALATELDTIRRDIEDDLGERDTRYIHRTIAAQRVLEATGRLLLAFGSKRVGLVGRYRNASRWPRSSRIWRSPTTSCTASGTG